MRFKSIIKRNDTSVVIAVIILAFAFTLRSSSFLTDYNIFNVLRTSSLYIFVALGQAIVLVCGGMNLSIGAIGGLAVITGGIFLDTLNVSPIISSLVVLLVGCIAGLLNGVLIIKLKANSFVVTLASSFVYTGLVFGISKGFPYTNIPESFGIIGRKGIAGIPYLFLLACLALSVIAYIFKYTVTGRQILATGGNEKAARLSGINTSAIILISNTASGFWGALAGLLYISRMASANPSTGTDWLIISFAVAVIGGTALSGGEIKPVGLFASGILIALIQNGLVIIGVNVYYEQTYLGVIILLAIAIDSFHHIKPCKALENAVCAFKIPGNIFRRKN